jgi:hypothetical protein
MPAARTSWITEVHSPSVSFWRLRNMPAARTTRRGGCENGFSACTTAETRNES